MPGEGDPPLCCIAEYVGGDPSTIVLQLCGAELRHIGPTVGEWRATNETLQACRGAADRDRTRLEGMLAEADQALAACSAQLDAALIGRERSLTIEQAAAAIASTLRLPPEMEARGWAPRFDCQPLTPSAIRRQRTWGADPEGLDEEPDEDAEHASSDLAAELARRLGQCERDRAAAEARADEWRVKAQTEQAGRLEAERKVQRRAFGFTLVRDVNGQTEGALRKAERHLRELRTESYNQRREVARLVALCHEHGIDPTEPEEE